MDLIVSVHVPFKVQFGDEVRPEKNVGGYYSPHFFFTFIGSPNVTTCGGDVANNRSLEKSVAMIKYLVVRTRDPGGTKT
jgi:hypothetical protein